MKHEFIGEPVYISESLYEVTIKLIAENQSEAKAVRNVEIGKANDVERDFINNYLLLGVSGWSTLSIKSQIGTIFKLKATNI